MMDRDTAIRTRVVRLPSVLSAADIAGLDGLYLLLWTTFVLDWNSAVFVLELFCTLFGYAPGQTTYEHQRVGAGIPPSGPRSAQLTPTPSLAAASVPRTMPLRLTQRQHPRSSSSGCGSSSTRTSQGRGRTLTLPPSSTAPDGWRRTCRTCLRRH